MPIPPHTPAEAISQQTFTALMWALSYPGRPYDLPAELAPFHAVADALLDIETTYFTPDSDLEATLRATGARARRPSEAAYHFYPTLSGPDLAHIEVASIGTLLYPDSAATLIIGCTFGGDQVLQLSGPGILSTVTLAVSGVPKRLWALRGAARYPLGWDMFLIDGRRVIGLPRSTVIREG
jgi:alpha-D-ribose 1-methylphosphonate 5-triphosphate synthase subunit PhnH